MESEEAIKKAIEALKSNPSNSANMNYEIGGAISALEWVLSKEKGSPTWIGRRF